MNLSKNDLRKILYDFNSWTNRLFQADFHDYLGVLTKYISFLNHTPIIIGFITDCKDEDFNAAEEVRAVQSGYGRYIFSIGNTESEEVWMVYAVLKYIVDQQIDVNDSIARGYSSSTHYQDKIKGFNERFVMVLSRHIENFLSKVGIDMGLDDKHIYNVTVHNGQAIIAGDNSTVNATNNNGLDADQLNKLIDAVKSGTATLSEKDRETATECIEVIEAEAISAKPKKSLLKTALKTLDAIKYSAEFAAAVATLIQFFAPMF